MRFNGVLRAVSAMFCAAVVFCSGCRLNDGADRPDPSRPVSIELWHYYNGPQKAVLDRMVAEFNETAGAKHGVVVEAYNRGTVEELSKKVIAAAQKEIGAEEVPNIFTAYADTAYAVDRLGVVADLDAHFTKDELASYVPGYIAEGRMGGETLKIFPVAKSTEVLILNKTDWQKFADATGADFTDLETIEDVTETARGYYEWTDGLTPEPDDGKSLFGRDAISNYLLVGSVQLGADIFTVKDGACTLQLDKAVMRRLWDNYYVPLVNGWFSANRKFRSDDMKAGSIIAMVGSVSGTTYGLDRVVVNDTESYPVETVVLPAPRFRDGGAYAVQQGAGMVVTRSDEAHEYACALFLKWFTDTQRNLAFTSIAGYMPVKIEANGEEAVREFTANEEDASPLVREAILAGMDIVRNNSMYTCPAFPGSMEARALLESELSGRASADAAEVQKLVEGGMSRAEAAARFTTDANFEEWYAGLRQGLETIIQNAAA